MEIVVHHCQILNNKEIFDCLTTYTSIDDLRSAIVEIMDNWSNIHGGDTMITCPDQLKNGSRIVLRCATNNDIEAFEIRDIILGDISYLADCYVN